MQATALKVEQRRLCWAYQRGDHSPEARDAWREYRRDRERARWARLRAETGMSNRQIRAQRKAERES
jgi:hypothetical protein